MMWRTGTTTFFATMNDPKTDRRDSLRGLKGVKARHKMWWVSSKRLVTNILPTVVI